MCMSLFSALTNAEKTQRAEPPPGFSKLTVSEAEKAIVGNLCRCTGYRSIADACKSFAADVDMEDLGFNSFWKKGDSKKVKVTKLPFYNPSNQVSTFPEFLKNEFRSSMLFISRKNSWYNPTSVKELTSMLKSTLAESGARAKLVVSNTGSGYYKEIDHYDKYIDLRCIPDLSMIRRDRTGIEIGAAVTISKAISVLKEENKSEFLSHGEVVFQKIADHMERIASGFIRNSASVGGNLVMAQRNHFPSDIATILLAVGSEVNVITDLKHEKVTLEEFLGRPPLDSTSVLMSVHIPCWEPVRNVTSKTDARLVFETYRAAPRPLGNALPYLNAAFLAEVTPCKTSSGVIIGNIQLALGAYGSKHAIRARKVEEFLVGKLLNAGVLYGAIKLLGATVVPEVGTSNAAYRSSLAVNFLFQFLCPFVDACDEFCDGLLHGCNDAFLLRASETSNNQKQFDHIKNAVLPLSAKQVVELNQNYSPVGEPITKAGSAIQASGEAVYVDDIPSPTNCLHGAFIYSTKPLAWVKRVKLNSKYLQDNVAGVISFRDIPKGGENIGSKTIFGIEPLFADDITRCAGQALAFVVADTQKLADMAAENAWVDYDTGNLEPPILTVEEAVEGSSFIEVPPFLYPAQIGDFSKGMNEADQKILSAEIKLGSQYHFYMETQSALAIPDEDNCMLVYSASQCPEFVHSTIARCLGVPEHNVRVVTRRVGGAFGGKATRSMHVATACALAAHKLGRPVRLYLNRKTDMVMAGGRHPMKVTYSVGFKSNGKITALHLDILINAGIAADVSPAIPHNILNALKKYDWGALSFDIKLCKTNHSSKTAMRAPGELQGSFIAEAVIEHVASMLSMEVDSVRKQNLHTFDSLKLFYKGSEGEPLEYTLPSIWDKLARSSCLAQRIETAQQFNGFSKWRKRGISRVPIIHGVAVRPTPGKVSVLLDGSVVVEVGGIELGQGLWTKVKQMTAFALSSVKCDGTEDLLYKVRVIQSDSLSLIQGGFTAGSTTSESSCEAVRLCCNTLVERLKTLKNKLQEQMGAIKWETLIQQAYLQSVNLSASSYYVPDFTSMQYLNYGAAVSEVEVNLLTGETTILQSDIIYDCGQSLNPAVDLGQIEGAFVQGIGFFMLEEYATNSDGLVVANNTWTYKIPTVDTIPKRFNVEVLSSGNHQKRLLSSKASGEPPLLLAASVHCATRAAIKEARKQLASWKGLDGSHFSTVFQLEVPATMPVVKELCGLDSVECFLKSLLCASRTSDCFTLSCV
ncbi:abscisic-aldehyde oxidase-like isoform X2 [Diospyros lotus]|nr:abscisic-aldehyde oxidase-like isoform X2 [Diospyros lotus]